MEDKIAGLFSGIEIQKKEQVNSLMSDWRSEIASKDRSEYFGKEDPLSYFVSDGFFPGYFRQEKKVLFIGREARHAAGDYIESSIKGDNEKNDHNKSHFTRVMYYIVQGIKGNGKLEFKNLKKANDYAKEMVNTNDYGFAFMNISKYTNDTDEGANADFYMINKFLEHSNLENRNYFREELEILDPDIIITMNLWDGHIDRKYLDLCFGKIELDINDGKVNFANIVLNNKNVKLLNTYAFSSFYSEQEYFYDPLMELIFRKEDK